MQLDAQAARALLAWADELEMAGTPFAWTGHEKTARDVLLQIRDALGESWASRAAKAIGLAEAGDVSVRLEGSEAWFLVGGAEVALRRATSSFTGGRATQGLRVLSLLLFHVRPEPRKVANVVKCVREAWSDAPESPWAAANQLLKEVASSPNGTVSHDDRAADGQ
jgi:hypothetical protein